MKDKKELYTITVFTENHPGLLSRIANIFTRRKLNIESLTVSGSEYESIHRFNILLKISEEQVHKIVKQIEKQVEVFDAFARKEQNTTQHETTLFQIPTNEMLESSDIEALIRKYDVRLMKVNSDQTYFEKSGSREEINQMFEEMEKLSSIQHIRSVKSTFIKPDGKLANIL
ncbi:MAG: acetolactate synthase small subunit [Bacteroidales bacterium]